MADKSTETWKDRAAPAGTQDWKTRSTPIEKNELGMLDIAKGTARAVGEGALMGSEDELEAFLTPGSTEENLKRIRAEQSQFSNLYPKTNIAANLAGGVGSVLAGGAVLSGVKGAVGVARLGKAGYEANKVAQAAEALAQAKKTATLGSVALNATKAVGTGAGVGGVTAFNEGEGGFENRLSNAEEGVLTGGMFGGGIYGTGKLLGGLVKGIVSRFPSAQKSEVSRYIEQRLVDQGMTLEQAEARLAELGPQATLADLGISTARLADSMAAAPGKSAQIAVDTFGNRAKTAASRLVESVRRNINSKEANAEGKIIENLKKATSPNFTKAFNENQNVMSDLLDSYRSNPDIKPILQSAFEKARRTESIFEGASGKEVPNKAYGQFVTDSDGVTSIVNPSLRYWHNVLHGLDDQIEGFRDPVTLRLAKDSEVRSLSEFRNKLSTELKNVTGGEEGAYAKANANYAGAAKMQGALKEGRAFAKGDAEVMEDMFQTYTAGEREMFRVGVAKELSNSLRNNPNLTPQMIKNIVHGDSILNEKIKTIAPTPAQFNRFVQDITNEIQFQKTSNTIRGGSQTASRLAEEEANQSAQVKVAGVLGSLLMGHPGAAVSKATHGIISSLNKYRIPQKTRDEIGKRLMSTDPEIKKMAIEDLRKVVGTEGFDEVVSEITSKAIAPIVSTGQLTPYAAGGPVYTHPAISSIRSKRAVGRMAS